ncbi:MAG: hypothetical protein ABIS47_03450 [Acidimicrobiales bacterium]
MRPVVVVLVVLTVLVVGTVVLGANHTSPGEARTEALAYLDQVRPVIERSSATGRDLASVRQRAVGLDRDLLDRQLSRVQADADSALAEGRAVTSSDGGDLAQDLLIGALGGRAAAVKELRNAFGQALDVQTPLVPAIQAFSEVGRDLQAADGAYRLFGRNLPPGSAPPPESRWVGDPQEWSAPILGGFVTSLRNSKNLAPVHDLAVLVAAPDPGPVGEEQGKILVLASVPTIRLQVVVANQGNQPERSVPVVASTQPFDGSPASSDRVTVDLEPGQRRALDMSKLVPPPSGATFAIIVRVGATPDSNPTDDEFPVRQYVLR